VKLTEHIHLVGSGSLGMYQTDALDCNVYLLNGGDKYMLIDGGAGRQPEAIIHEIEQDGLDPAKIEWIFVTHGHADHSGGVSALQLITQATVIASQATARILEMCDEAAIHLPQAKKAGIYPEEYHWQGCAPVTIVRDGETMSCGSFTVRWIATPGHSADMMSCYIEDLQALFCSDLVFPGGKIAPLATADFSISALSNSISVIHQFPVQGLFSGHLHPQLRQGSDSIDKVYAQLSHMIFPDRIGG
jgi:hydroxyacylglutathione hydrolase